ncbi:MAG: hypothetical protein J2P21_18865 [Chloracidobacterium sp.]|nr:hypothetical protein [Chloracidobacterium sp.]
MTTIKSILRRLVAPVRSEAAGREIEDELLFHFGDFDRIRAVCEEIRKELSRVSRRRASSLPFQGAETFCYAASPQDFRQNSTLLRRLSKESVANV